MSGADRAFSASGSMHQGQDYETRYLIAFALVLSPMPALADIHADPFELRDLRRKPRPGTPS